MSQRSPIEWTDRTSNPIRAFDPEGKRGWMCAHVSEGCRNCYAERINIRLGTGGEFTAVNVKRVKFELNDLELGHLLKLRKPSRVFLCDMTDMFGEWIPFEWLDRIFATMALCPQQTFQILTKRPRQMHEYLKLIVAGAGDTQCRVYHAAQILVAQYTRYGKYDAEGDRAAKRQRILGRAAAAWPLRNVWLGVSCEDQKTADERIPVLLETPAAVRWLSAEPLLGPIDLSRTNGWGVDWLVAGGESGNGARPMHPDWVRALRDQCIAASVPFFFKQWGAWAWTPPGWEKPVRVGKRKAGRELDGRTWEEFPHQVGA